MSILVFLAGAALMRRAFVEDVDVDYVIVRLVELGLCEERQQAVVAAMAVDDQDLLAAVARHLVGGFLQERELHRAAVGHGSGLVLSLGDLAEIVFRENDGVFLRFGGMQRGIADVEKIGAERKVRGTWKFLEDSKQGAGMFPGNGGCLRGSRTR